MSTTVRLRTGSPPWRGVRLVEVSAMDRYPPWRDVFSREVYVLDRCTSRRSVHHGQLVRTQYRQTLHRLGEVYVLVNSGRDGKASALERTLLRQSRTWLGVRLGRSRLIIIRTMYCRGLLQMSALERCPILHNEASVSVLAQTDYYVITDKLVTKGWTILF